MTTALQIAFPKVDTGSQQLAVPSTPPAPVASGLASYAATPETRKVLSCKKLLAGDTLARAEAEAADLLPKMLANTQIFATYGTGALEGVNRLVDRLLKEVEPARIPELTALMRDLNSEMRGIRSKYDPQDPKVRKLYEQGKVRAGLLWHKVVTLVELLMEDIKSIDSQIEAVSAKLEGKQLDLIRNVSYYDAIYEQNEAEIGQLIYVIGVMESIRDQAALQASSITVGNEALGDREGERKARLSELVSNMEVKITEYKGRLWVAWATSPQVRTMRTLNVGLAEKINELVCVTIPTMKMTIVQWRLLMETHDAAKMAQVVADASNEWITAFAGASAQAVPLIAEAVQTPTLTPETVMAMAASIEAQAEGVITAMENGVQRRQALDEAIVAGKQVLDAATERVSQAQVEHVLAVANAAPLQIVTSVRE